MRRVLVIGGGGGIGLALVDALAARRETDLVCATHRRAVSSVSSVVRWVEASLEDTAAIETVASEMIDGGGLDGIIIATGLLHGEALRPEKSLRELTAESLMASYFANAAAPMLLLAALKPLLRRDAVPFICLLSAQVGSIGDNRLGGWYGYRMGKAALNMGIRTAAIELARERICTRLLAVHPGTTKTSLSTPFIRRRRAVVSTPQETAQRILDLLEDPTAFESGAFINADGQPLPW